MNNLKRVLSLGLTGAMLAGLLTVGASAADFTDVEKIQHDEAVNVLVALNVIDGKPDGSFDPEGNVTRAEMAKMIAVAMNGGNEANTGTKTTPSFTDIKGHWAESYIEYCHDLGIISGRGDGTFDPGSNVTGLEATKMVLSAMGFDAEAYKLTGAQWAVRTDEVARTMTGQGWTTTVGGAPVYHSEPGMYDDLASVMMANNATRDTAAQLIWNGLQNRTRTVQPTTTAAGGVEWTYVTNSTTLLQQRYSANTMEGTFYGNKDTDATSEDGFIKVDDAEFPYDFDIDNIGEEVKVIWRDGKGGSDAKPDKHDTIFGVFNTGKTQVYHTTKNALQDAEDKNNKKVKFGGTKYDTKDTTIEVTYDYQVKSSPDTVNVADINSASGWRVASPDQIKFVCDEDGKIVAAYVTTVSAGRVTSVTSTKITVSGLGTVDIEDNNVAEGLKKDDIVIFTKFYKSKVADAFVTITKAETVEGKITGFKGDAPKHENLVLDGTTYKVAGKELKALTADNAYTKAATDDEVRLYLCEGLVMAAEALSEAGGKYALVIDKDSGTVGSALSGLKLIVMTPDGEKHTVTVDKNSTKNDKDSADKLTSDADVAIGDLVEYSTLSNGSIKIKTLAKDADSKNGVATKVADTNDIWDKDSKKLQVTVGSTTGFVATSSAPLFVSVKGKGAASVDANADFYVYTLRDLGNIENKTGGEVTIQAYLDGSEVVAAAVELKNKPSSNTADTLYGMVKSKEGIRKAPNGDDKTLYKVIVADEIIDVYTDATLAKGDLITFDQTSNNVYDDDAFTQIVTADDTVAADWTLAAIVDNDSDLLKYYAETKAADGATAENPSYDGKQVSTAFDKDVTVIYVDADAYDVGDNVDYKVYDPANGYANAVFHVDSGKIDVIIIETSGEANLAKAGDKKDAGTTKFGPAIAAKPAEKVTLVNKNASIAADTGKAGAYTVELSDAEVEVGKDFTVTVKCGSVDGNNTNGEVVTVTYNSEDKTVEFTGVDNTGKSVTFTAVKGATDVTASVAAKS